MGLDITGLNTLAAFDTPFISLLISICFGMSSMMVGWFVSTFYEMLVEEKTPTYEVESSSFSDFEESWFDSCSAFEGVDALVKCGWFDTMSDTITDTITKVVVESDDDSEDLDISDLNMFSLRTQFMGLMSIPTYQECANKEVRFFCSPLCNPFPVR